MACARFWQIVRIKDFVSSGARERVFVRIIKAFGFVVVVWNSRVRVSMSQAVRMGMSWLVCAPVGSSSRTTRWVMGDLGRRVAICSLVVVVGYSGGRWERVSFRERMGYSSCCFDMMDCGS